ncbi:MAG TPA: hypothetical protein VHE99_05930 [Gammaproteobacteria bacterium]|nr:hypothetical protein [Gammaproteobacteria bacterium]
MPSGQPKKSFLKRVGDFIQAGLEFLPLRYKQPIAEFFRSIFPNEDTKAIPPAPLVRAAQIAEQPSGQQAGIKNETAIDPKATSSRHNADYTVKKHRDYTEYSDKQGNQVRSDGDMKVFSDGKGRVVISDSRNNVTNISNSPNTIIDNSSPKTQYSGTSTSSGRGRQNFQQSFPAAPDYPDPARVKQPTPPSPPSPPSPLSGGHPRGQGHYTVIKNTNNTKVVNNGVSDGTPTIINNNKIISRAEGADIRIRRPSWSDKPPSVENANHDAPKCR